MPEPIICPITQEPIFPGEEFTLLSGHVFDARALAIWVARPELQGNPLQQDATTRNITIAWIYGKKLDVFDLGRLFYDDRLEGLQDRIHSTWMQETPTNPLTRAVLTPIEKTALAEKICLMNHHTFFNRKENHSDVPSPEQFTNWTLDEQYKFMNRLGLQVSPCYLSGFEFWANARLGAYAIVVLAKQFVQIPNKIDPEEERLLIGGSYASRNPENGSSHIWQLTQCLMRCIVFDERNHAILALLNALPKEQQLSFIDLVKKLQEGRQFGIYDVNGMDIPTYELMFQAGNAKLNDKMTQYVEQHFTPEVIAADYGRYARSGFEAPRVTLAADAGMRGVKRAREVLNQIKTEDESDDKNDSNSCSIR